MLCQLIKAYWRLGDSEQPVLMFLQPSRTTRPAPGDEVLRLPLGAAYAGTLQADVFHHLSRDDTVRFKWTPRVAELLPSRRFVELRFWADYMCGGLGGGAIFSNRGRHCNPVARGRFSRDIDND